MNWKKGTPTKKSEWIKKYHEEQLQDYTVRLHKIKDKDLIEYINSHTTPRGKTALFRHMLRGYIWCESLGLVDKFKMAEHKKED